MSADEFDPFVERLFSRTPPMADADLFTAGVEARLQKGSRFRSLAIVLAGVVGGVVAVRETVNVNVNLGEASEGIVAGQALGQGMQSASIGIQTAVDSALSGLGLDQLELGSVGGMQIFWLAAAGVIALATISVVRLSQEV
ncbi:MAG: hypothetical protein DCF29_19070 [Alphaproteobacteria bacterium]|nr:MAG: hypothetical protein DCF29_19070 [Alphaproteobacteria bacterium]